MENKVFQNRFGRLSEYEKFDGEAFITFNIADVDCDGMTAVIAVTNRGRISVVEYPLEKDENDELFFEYGALYERVYLNDFAEVA